MLTTEQQATGHGFRRATVVGAGLMGRGIAGVLAAGGLDVTVCDVRAEAARDGLRDLGAADPDRLADHLMPWPD